jgi:hypothetical protein
MATKKTTAVKTVEEPKKSMVLPDLDDDFGAGLEGADHASFAIPFLIILQPLSPQIDTVEGAKAGMLLNTIGQQLLKEAHVVPCAFTRKYLRWAPRDEGGGYRGEYSPGLVETGQIAGVELRDGRYYIGKDELKDTRNHFCLLIDEEAETYTPVIVSLSSTQIKKSKRWASLMSSKRARDKRDNQLKTEASYRYAYTISTLKESNDKGAWWGCEVTDYRRIDKEGSSFDNEVWLAAKAFNQQVTSGEVKVQPLSPEQHDPDAF